MITQAELAKLTGVDRTTVSKILSGYRLEQFSPEIIEKVRATAVAKGYKAKKFRSALDIGFIIPDYIRNVQFYSQSQRILQTIFGINDAIAGSNNRLIILRYNNEPNVVAKKSDVFLVWEMSNDNKLHHTLQKSNKEFMTLNRVGPDYNASYVVHDLAYSCRKAVTELVDAGHQKIAFVAPKPAPAYRREFEMIISELDMHGLPASEANYCSAFDESDDGFNAAAEKLKNDKFTAFIAGNDMIAHRVVSQLSKLGLKVPDDISAIGNHQTESSLNRMVDLASFITPWYDMGKIAAEHLLNRAKRSDSETTSTICELVQPHFYPGKSIKKL